MKPRELLPFAHLQQQCPFCNLLCCQHAVVPAQGRRGVHKQNRGDHHLPLLLLLLQVRAPASPAFLTLGCQPPLAPAAWAALHAAGTRPSSFLPLLLLLLPWPLLAVLQLQHWF